MANIMIVEDDEAIVELYEQVLALLDHTVTATPRDGAVALRMLEEGPALPDLIILDHRMPGLTGLQLMAALPARAAAIPIVFATADESVRAQAKEAGAAAVLVKPFSMDRMIAEIDRALAAPGGGRQGGAPASA